MYLLSLYYAPNLTETYPPWLYLLNFFLILAYQTVDALDGKQARRTRTSSPLGELFDHGCDSFAIFFVLVSTASVLRTGITYFIYFGTAVILLSFYTTQLEDYFTDVLTLGYFDATEGQIIAMILNLVAFFKGPQVFSYAVPLFKSITFSELFIYMCIITGIFHVARNIWQIFSVVKLREFLLADVLQRLLSVSVLLIVASAWYFIESTSMSTHSLHLYLCMLTLAFANLIIQTIVARICQLKAPTTHFLLLIPALVGFMHANAGYPVTSNQNMIIAILTLYLVIYLHYVLSIVHQITTHLNIRCFITLSRNKASRNNKNLHSCLISPFAFFCSNCKSPERRSRFFAANLLGASRKGVRALQVAFADSGRAEQFAGKKRLGARVGSARETRPRGVRKKRKASVRRGEGKK
ncbi:uncharacterized CDP-alcohol phosphatidyltransferase class-I family protein 1-like [Schistocerca gregaria]|uniref:uncharacterized CDP-alcohol phosphatidyltransferase class-I family protein 1-like n=1 Tax=Schistocerca gregaria TaxID=7010 RepID=UPI00211F018D|nr:uncharacterized CDP-alcohol phosphatidyltransferase class-I family protein 1-like [Schistocerca gregaria]